MGRKGRHSEVFRDADGEWRWRVKGGNGEVMDQSEGYGSKSDAVRAADELHPDLRVWIIGDDGKASLLRSEGEVMGGPGEPPSP